MSEQKDNLIEVLKSETGYMYHEVDENETIDTFREITEHVKGEEIEALVPRYNEIKDSMRPDVIKTCIREIVYEKRYLTLKECYKKLTEDNCQKEDLMFSMYKTIMSLRKKLSEQTT